MAGASSLSTSFSGCLSRHHRSPTASQTLPNINHHVRPRPKLPDLPPHPRISALPRLPKRTAPTFPQYTTPLPTLRRVQPTPSPVRQLPTPSPALFRLLGVRRIHRPHPRPAARMETPRQPPPHPRVRMAAPRKSPAVVRQPNIRCRARHAHQPRTPPATRLQPMRQPRPNRYTTLQNPPFAARFRAPCAQSAAIHSFRRRARAKYTRRISHPCKR